MGGIMKFSLVKTGDVVVVELDGDVWGGWDSIQLKDSVAALLKAGDRKFLVDLERTGSVNSAGIGVLLAVQESIARAQGTLVLCSVSERARRTFAISEVWEQFTTASSRAEGLVALGVKTDEAAG
jgi:anti-anti-sigma factor